jgi:cyclic pyranopterin phosphate synthase
MSPDEIRLIVETAVGIGITRIKITGGEPLLRSDIVDIIQKITSVGIQDCSMTTNGTHLAPIAQGLFDAGLNRINISLPTLDPNKYSALVGGSLKLAMTGIEQALSVGFTPVKINMLLLRGINVNELPAMIKFAEKKGVILQLIELEPLNTTTAFFNQHHMNLNEIEENLKQRAIKITTRRKMQNRKIYTLPHGSVEVIQPIENAQFCAGCSRLRITSDGKIKPCLMRQDNHVDLLKAIRSNSDSKVLRSLFLEAIERREPFY